MSEATTVVKGQRVLVAGGGGFIGGHLARAVLEAGAAHVRVVDLKPLQDWYQVHDGAENLTLDLADQDLAFKATDGREVVFQLAADMGGMGFIENNKALCMLSVLPTTHLLQAAVHHDIRRFFYSSSACVYAAQHQTDPDVTALKESDAYPAEPEDGYGWEKLFSERMCRHFAEDFGLPTRIARYHNVYGPHGTWTGGREKAPAAICRKVAQAKRSGATSIPIWGDGKQSRSFTYIDDCIEGTLRLTASDVGEPINIGSSELVTIDELVSIACRIADVELDCDYDLSAPQGVRGRNSDNTFVREELGWEPSISLHDGLEQTYHWIAAEIDQGR